VGHLVGGVVDEDVDAAELVRSTTSRQHAPSVTSPGSASPLRPASLTSRTVSSPITTSAPFARERERERDRPADPGVAARDQRALAL
jgi:hypothetical protein